MMKLYHPASSVAVTIAGQIRIALLAWLQPQPQASALSLFSYVLRRALSLVATLSWIPCQCRAETETLCRCSLCFLKRLANYFKRKIFNVKRSCSVVRSQNCCEVFIYVGPASCLSPLLILHFCISGMNGVAVGMT